MNMKKIIALVLTMVTLLLSLLCLFSCTETEAGDEAGAGTNIGGDMLVGVVTDDPKNNRISMQTTNGVDYVVNISTEQTHISKDGAKIAYTDIKKGEHVKVAHTGIVTRSIPPQITATRVEVITQQTAKSVAGTAETYSMRARVKSIDEGVGMRVEVISSDYAAGDYYFYVGDETTVYDGAGAVVAFSYVKVGDVVNVVYGNAVTLSMPPKTNAIRIVVE